MTERKTTKRATTKRIEAKPASARGRTRRFAATDEEAPKIEAPQIEAPKPIEAPKIEAPQIEAPKPIEAPASEPALTVSRGASVKALREREWVPIVFEGQGMVVDADAGVFVAGTRTRLRAPTAQRLLGIDGFRIAF